MIIDLTKDQLTQLNKEITRVEIIDDKGRSYTSRNIRNIQLSIQDKGKTLKLFIKK